MHKKTKASNPVQSSPETLTTLSDEQKAGKIEQLIVDGHDVQDIAQAVAKWFPEDDPNEIIRKAIRDLCVKQPAALGLREQFLDKAALRLYQKMVEVGDYQGALKALKFIRDNNKDPKPINV